MALDMNAVIEDGEMAGLTVQQALDYASAVKSAAAEGREAPAVPAKETPAARLQADATGRVDQVTLMTMHRLEQDDEATFAASLPAGEYDKFKEKITALKNGMPPQTRIMKGVHERLYHHILLEDPAMRARLRGETAPPVVPPVVPPTPPVVPPPVVPQAAPPIAPPTPPGRTVPPTSDAPKPTLKATEKILAAARIAKMNVDDYLLELESRGVTQEQLETQSVRPEPRDHQRSAAYARTRTR